MIVHRMGLQKTRRAPLHVTQLLGVVVDRPHKSVAGLTDVAYLNVVDLASLGDEVEVRLYVFVQDRSEDAEKVIIVEVSGFDTQDAEKFPEANPQVSDRDPGQPTKSGL